MTETPFLEFSRFLFDQMRSANPELKAVLKQSGYFCMKKSLAGIYIHIPFCRQACHYCDFHFSTNLNLISSMVESLQNEIKLQKEFLGPSKIQTIYLGGGTPSILSTVQLRSLLDEIWGNFKVADDVELTFEVNPEDVNEQT